MIPTVKEHLLVFLLFQICAATWSRAFAEANGVPVEFAKPFLTINMTVYGPFIEAASVDKFGSIYATDFHGNVSALGRVASRYGRLHQDLFFRDRSDAAQFNGLRFLPTSAFHARHSGHGIQVRALAADVNGQQIVQIQKSGPWGKLTSSVFCHDATMVKTNDVAIATRAGRVYASGQNYTSDTVVGDGGLWMCEAPSSFFNVLGSQISGPVKVNRLAVLGRTNGIEVSPDEKTLYLSEAFNKNNTVVSNKIWKYAIDPSTGDVSNQTLFVDFQQLDNTESIDIDGMRTDILGNLYVTRNGGGEVVKFSPGGELLLRIKLTTIKATTNLEFGGPHGKSLVILGKCDDGSPFGQGKGCAEIWRGSSVPGRAFSELNHLTPL